jgi:zinc transport system substrate-binding protein
LTLGARWSYDPRTKVRAILISIAVAALGTACASKGSTSSGDGPVAVVASFYPVFEAAVRVGGDRVSVVNLTAAGVEPHDLELTPPQVDQILDADVLLYLGEGFQPAVEAAARDRSIGVSVDLLRAISAQLRELPSGSQEHGTDPHVWLDPVLMEGLVERTRDALVTADPEGRATYRANAAAFLAELRQLDQRYRAGLTGCSRDVMVTSHAAFGYLSARYGLRQEAISGISPDAEPDPARLAELADLVRRDGVTTIFTEELVSPEVADTLARETGATTAVLDPLEGLTKEEAAQGEDYVSIMERNLATLRAALGCP